MRRLIDKTELHCIAWAIVGMRQQQVIRLNSGVNLLRRKKDV